MQTSPLKLLKSANGITLTELMVVTVIVALLALIAASTMQAFFDRARVAKAIGTAKVIQAAMTNATMTRVNAGYPAAIATYRDLVTLVNDHGASLEPTETAMGVALQGYTPIDIDGDRFYDDYTLHLTVVGVSHKRRGWCITVRPFGVEVCLPE